MSSSLSSIQFGIDEKAARVVQKHPRLTAMLPAEVDELVTGFLGAKALAAAVSDLPVESVDLTDEVDASLRAGEVPDAAELVDRYATAKRKADELRAVRAELAALPVRFVSDIVRMINEEVRVMPDVLAEELDELLDRAAEVVAQLDGIDSAEAAVDAEKAAEWRQLKTLAAEYADLRQAQVALARLENPLNLTPGSVGLALIMFGGIERVVPDLARRLTSQVRNAITGEAITALPFPLFDLGSPLHLLAVARSRAVLEPHVVHPSEIAERLAAVHAAAELPGVQPTRTSSDQLGGEHEAVQVLSRRARNATIATPKVSQPWG
ncbi:hypothetical protein [Geodermatophilus sp. URMC 62]|uniref:hypothetical protein n=1 Tax=Geodermatophilus sp. URMC 62 TaxID=3423414 RepID=UPI00406C940E